MKGSLKDRPKTLPKLLDRREGGIGKWKDFYLCMRFVTIYVWLEKSNVGQSLSMTMPLITNEEGEGGQVNDDK